MVPRIKKIKPMENFHLYVQFDDGKEVLYDVNSDIEEIPSYVQLKQINGMFSMVKLDPSRTCIYWNEDIDLPSDAIYEYGDPI